MTLIEDFRRELKDILDNVVKEPLRQGAFRVIEKSGKILSFPDKIARSHLRAIRILRVKSRNIGKFISDQKLEELLEDFLFSIKYDDEVEGMAEIDKHIIRLFDKLRKIPSQRHLFIIPIMHLRLSQNVTIGDSVLVNLNAQTLEAFEAKYSVKLRFADRDLSQVVEEMVKTNETGVFAVVVVDAPDDDKALELGVQKADTCLNVLRLYYSNGPFVLRMEHSTALPRRIMHVNLDEKIYTEMHGSVHLVVNIPTLDSKVLERMKKGNLEIINQLLCEKTDELEQLQRDILTAIFWFGNAVKEKSRNMKFIKSFIALETLLVPDGGFGKGDRISKRFASIIYDSASDNEKKEVFLTMRSLYDIRNSIIHSGEGYVYEDDLNQIIYWTQATIQFLLQYATEYEDIFNLIEQEF